jgi:putative addiction module killer protein
MRRDRGASDAGVFSLAAPSQGCQCRPRIVARIRRVEHGNPGDIRSVGEGILEMRIDHGPGYRIYYLPRGQTVILL